jgi:hypothetical protein
MRVFALRPVRAAFAAIVVVSLSGCGYSVRPPFDRSIRTVYVPIFRSFTFRKDMNLMLTERLHKEIERRTPFKVVGTREGADAVLEGTINFVDKNMIVESPFNLPRQINALISAEVRFYDNRPGAPEPPSSPAVVTEVASFYPELGETSQLGFQKAIDKLVTQIVGMMEEKW